MRFIKGFCFEISNYQKLTGVIHAKEVQFKKSKSLRIIVMHLYK